MCRPWCASGRSCGRRKFATSAPRMLTRTLLEHSLDRSHDVTFSRRQPIRLDDDGRHFRALWPARRRPSPRYPRRAEAWFREGSWWRAASLVVECLHVGQAAVVVHGGVDVGVANARASHGLRAAVGAPVPPGVRPSFFTSTCTRAPGWECSSRRICSPVWRSRRLRPRRNSTRCTVEDDWPM